MSNKILPYFEIEGKKYEIKATRHLLAEFDKLNFESRKELGEDTEKDLAKGFRATTKLNEITQKFREIKNEFFEKPNDDELYKTYKRFEALYNEAIDEYDNFNNKEEGFRKIQESMVNNLEKAVIIALKEQYELSEEKAIEIWQKHVDEIGVIQASEWLLFMNTELFIKEEEESPFLKQAREKALKEAERKKSILRGR